MNTRKNVVMRYASGMLGGQVVAREWKGRPYIANRPVFRDDREFSESQLTQQQRFLDGSAYAKRILAGENVPEIYVTKAESARITVYNVAMRDFLKPPNVREIDVGGYTGKPGEVIVIRADDDTEVVSVSVSIHNGEVVEQGEAVRDEFNPTLWTYTVTEPNEIPGTKVEAYAIDRPGNVVGAMVEL